MRPQTKTITSLTNDANGIFQDQTTGGAADLTLNGALVTSGVASLPLTGKAAIAQQISIEGSGDNSGISFLITGTDADNRVISEYLAGSNTATATTTTFFLTVTAISSTAAVTGNVEGGWLNTTDVVTSSIAMDYRSSSEALIRVNLSTNQQVLITSSADDSAVEFVVDGINETGAAVKDIFFGSNSTIARSSKLFSKVSAIDTVGNADTVTAGTDGDPDGIAQSQNPAADANLTLNGALVAADIATLTTAMTYTVEHSFDDPNSSTVPTWIDTDELTGLNADAEGNMIKAVQAVRLKLTSYTSGTVSLDTIQ